VRSGVFGGGDAGETAARLGPLELVRWGNPAQVEFAVGSRDRRSTSGR